jgi:DNA-binding response OmpR family regulator
MNHVLLVEPDDDLCLFLRFAIAGVGCRVTMASSVADATDLLGGNERVDVMITSASLPDGSGVLLAREALKRAKHIFVLRRVRDRIEVADKRGVVFRGDRFATGAFLHKAIAQRSRARAEP